jgi:hypothetical protein
LPNVFSHGLSSPPRRPSLPASASDTSSRKETPVRPRQTWPAGRARPESRWWFHPAAIVPYLRGGPGRAASGGALPSAGEDHSLTVVAPDFHGRGS